MCHGGGWSCLCKSDRARACEAVGVCACVYGHARVWGRPASSRMGMGRTSSLILLKEDSVGKVAAPRSSCSPHRDIQTPYLTPPSNTPPHVFPPVTPSPLHPHQLSLLHLSPNFPSLTHRTPPKTQNPTLVHSPIPAIHHSKLNLH